MDVKGAINKRITPIVVEGTEIPPLGSPVWCDGKEVGHLSSAVRHEGRVFGLGIVRKTAWEDGTSVQVIADGRTWAGKTVALPSA